MGNVTFKHIVLISVLVSAAMLCQVCRGAEQDVHALRSAYLYYFSNFIQWPQNSVFNSNQLNLCALTDDEQDHFQLSTIEGQSIGSLKLKITIIDSRRTPPHTTADIELLQGCHLIYLSEHYNHSSYAEQRSRLTRAIFVTEGNASHAQDVENIGDIHLFKYDNKLNFHIDATALQSRNFEASAKLLRLSKPVARP